MVEEDDLTSRRRNNQRRVLQTVRNPYYEGNDAGTNSNIQNNDTRNEGHDLDHANQDSNNGGNNADNEGQDSDNKIHVKVIQNPYYA